MEKLGKLKPKVSADATVMVCNASDVNDVAYALLLGMK